MKEYYTFCHDLNCFIIKEIEKSGLYISEQVTNNMLSVIQKEVKSQQQSTAEQSLLMMELKEKAIEDVRMLNESVKLMKNQEIEAMALKGFLNEIGYCSECETCTGNKEQLELLPDEIKEAK